MMVCGFWARRQLSARLFCLFEKFEIKNPPFDLAQGGFLLNLIS